ncbi:hypothetical protein [Haloterrigena salifodinae]|nr:hypothetical protein [Haloterrigena salifodinae]
MSSETTNSAVCYYTGRPVETPNDVDVSISRGAVLEKISDGETRLAE